LSLILCNVKLCQTSTEPKSPILHYGRNGNKKGTCVKLYPKGFGKGTCVKLYPKGFGCEYPFVKLNCVSILRELLVGELFGYKKGAFIGAIKDHEEKIALLNGGTLFLIISDQA